MPRLGDIELQRLTPSNLSAFYRALLTDARRDGQGLAPKTVRNIHAMLHRALKDAVRLGYLVRNVADAVTPPRGASPEMQVWTPEQLRAFLDPRPPRPPVRPLAAGRHHRHAPRPSSPGCAGSTSTWTPLGSPRRRPRVVVNYVVHESEPKTPDGQAVAWRWTRPRWPPCRSTRLARSRNAPTSGAAWMDSGLVFTRPDGCPHPPRPHHRLVPSDSPAAAGLPPIRLHDVRHSYATAALAAGIPAKVVSERLGHANIAITLDVYSHVIPGMDAQAASDRGQPDPRRFQPKRRARTEARALH